MARNPLPALHHPFHSPSPGPYSQCVAILLLSWLLLGFLLPLLLLLPEADEARRRARHRRRGSNPPGNGSEASEPSKRLRLAEWAEAGLRMLLPPSGQVGAQQGEMPPGLAFALRWWVLVQVCWGACCAAAPLFGTGPGHLPA
jgi:hypothetical protein